MSGVKIFLIEDDKNLACVLTEALELQGHSVIHQPDGENAILTFLKEPIDLCLIDVMLPKKDGFSIAEEIRRISDDIPIIFLTAKSLKEDRIHGFEIGADDYVTKPFSMEELLLRIKAVCKRTQRMHSAVTSKQSFSIGDYLFEYDRKVLILHDQKIKLTHKEAELLRLLCLHINDILDRRTALKQIWEDCNTYSARSMDVYISKLRKYLQYDPRVNILNIHSKGFKLCVE